ASPPVLPSSPTRRSSDLELSALYPEITHGAGLAVMFPAWMEHVRGQNPGRFAFYGREVFGLAPTGDADADALSAIDETRAFFARSEEHTSELQSRFDLVC